VRGLALIAVGVAFVVVPSVAVAVVAVLVGLAVFLFGVAELDLVAERAREQQVAPESAGGWRWAWVFPVGAAVLAVGLLALVLVPAAVPQDVPVAAVVDDPDACNGFPQLCDRRFDEVAFPASHNSMSAADQQGWYLAEQPTTMVNSLDDGIRVFLIDTWYGQATASGVVTAQRSLARAQSDFTDGRATDLTPAMKRSIDRLRGEKKLGPEQVYMCHTLCELGGTALEPQLEGEAHRERDGLEGDARHARAAGEHREAALAERDRAAEREQVRLVGEARFVGAADLDREPERVVEELPVEGPRREAERAEVARAADLLGAVGDRVAPLEVRDPHPLLVADGLVARRDLRGGALERGVFVRGGIVVRRRATGDGDGGEPEGERGEGRGLHGGSWKRKTSRHSGTMLSSVTMRAAWVRAKIRSRDSRPCDTGSAWMVSA
jgi:hypothetical protein